MVNLIENIKVNDGNEKKNCPNFSGGFVVPGPYSPTFVRTGSASAGNSPAAGTAFGNHFLFPPPARSSHSHSLSPTSSHHTLPAPPCVTSSQPFSSYMAYSLSSQQLHAHAVQVRADSHFMKAEAKAEKIKEQASKIKD